MKTTQYKKQKAQSHGLGFFNFLVPLRGIEPPTY